MSNNKILYLFHIKLGNYKEFYLTSDNRETILNNQSYLPYSGLSMLSSQMNESGTYYIKCGGIFESLGIDQTDDLSGAYVQILHIFNGDIRQNFIYYCTQYERSDLNFIITCEPESIKYRKSLLKKFSRSCRANFGDKDCKVDVSKYTIEGKIIDCKKKFLAYSTVRYLLICEFTSFNDGYFTLGKLELSSKDGPMNFKIISHTGQYIEIEASKNLTIKPQDTIRLTPTCNKTFRSCCDFFNNSINFRGEPHIPEYKKLKC